MWAELGQMAVGGLREGLRDDGSGQAPQEVHSRWTDPYQGQLFQKMMKRGMSGAGDFGYGGLVKQGTGQLQQMMADRGIAPGSGAAISATGNMINQAMASEQQNRNNYMLNLMTATPQKERSEAGFKNNPWYGREDAGRAFGYKSGGSPSQQASGAIKDSMLDAQLRGARGY